MEKSKTKEKIFADMHRELRAWNADIPESPERLDPILRIVLQMYSHQLAQIDGRIDQVWEAAVQSLIRSLCPEGVHWPVPAFTVMRCQVTDPVVEVDTHTKFFYKERREGGQTFFFSPLRNEKLVSAQVRHMFLTVDNTLVDLSPQTEGASASYSRPRPAFTPGGKYRLYLGIEHPGPAGDLDQATVFMVGPQDLLKQMRWAHWHPGTKSGAVGEEGCRFCPGLTPGLEQLFAGGRGADWGGLRTGWDLFQPLEDNFVILPSHFTDRWEAGPPETSLNALLSRQGITINSTSGPLYWIRLDLPPGGDKAKFQSAFEMYLNCFVAVNKSELTLFKHTGGNRLVEVDLPDEIADILEVTGVVDSAGREYVARHQAGLDPTHRFYSPEERDGRLVLWFDFTSHLELPPDSLTINYATTAGVAANAIEAGKITELYESHPGISSVVNIIPTAGAIPAKTAQQIMTEVSARLRNRDRALTFGEISRWVMTFDPRIKNAVCENGVERAPRGVRRCIVVRATVGEGRLYSNDEVKLLQRRLTSFLKSRSAVNTQYRVEITKG